MIREAPSCVSRARARKRQYVEKQSFDVPDDPVESVELVKETPRSWRVLRSV